MLEQLARLVLPKEILDNFDIVKIETDESDIDAMSMTIHLDERMNAYLQKSEDYESKGFMDAVRITDFPIRDHKVILVLRVSVSAMQPFFKSLCLLPLLQHY